MKSPRSLRTARVSALGGLLLACALATPASAAAGPAAKGLDVYWIDVEGGAATLLVTPAGESILVDTGWPGPRDAERIRKVAMDEAGLQRIDHLVVTHWHQDHVGGVADLARLIPVAHYYDHGLPAAAAADVDPALTKAYLAATGGRSTVLHAGDTLRLRDAPGAPPLSARVVAAFGLVEGEPPGSPQTRPCPDPSHAARPDDTTDNPRSVGIVFSFGDFSLLDLGDLTWNVEHKLACPKNLVGQVDVFQVTHHGSDQSNNPVLLRALAPTVAILDNGAKKGGTAEVHRTLKAVPEIKDVFQLHRNVATTAADNAPPALVANDDEACAGQGIHLRVTPDAKHYTVEVPGKKTSRTYDVR